MSSDAPVFLSGVGRTSVRVSGEIVNHDNRLRDVFEPFDNVRNRECRRFALARYIRTDDRSADVVGPAQRILSGRLRNVWADAFNTAPRSSRLLVRECRSNLWLGWLHARFPDVKIVLVIRHPCAVASSRLLLELPT